MAQQGRLKSWQHRDRLVRNYQLPSCGWLYGDLLPDGMVTMKAMRGEDEEIIAGAGEGAVALPVLRDKVEQLTDLGNLPYKQLLFSDWVALLFNFFGFSYGSEMAFSPKCPVCKEFPSEPHIKDLEELDCTVYDTEPGFERDKFHEPFTTEPLPPYNDTVTFRLLRIEDQIAAENFFKKGKKAGKRGDFVRSFAMAKHIVGVNGEEVNLFEALDYVRNGTTGATLLSLRREFASVEPGYYMNIDLNCPQCGANFQVRLPEDGSFFRRVDSEHRQSKAAKALDAELRAGGTDLGGLGDDGSLAEGRLLRQGESTSEEAGAGTAEGEA